MTAELELPQQGGTWQGTTYSDTPSDNRIIAGEEGEGDGIGGWVETGLREALVWAGKSSEASRRGTWR